MAEDASTHCSSSKLRNTSVDPGYNMSFAVSAEQGTINPEPGSVLKDLLA